MLQILNTNEYDISYFDGKKSSLTHNAGFTSYERHYRKDPGNFSFNDQHFDNSWKDIAYTVARKYAMGNKKVLEIASAKGFVVEDLRSFGVDAYGLDVSQYAYDEASEEVKPFLTVGDARTYLSNYANNEFDLIFSIRYMECLNDIEIEPLINEMKRISKKQAHIITSSTLNSSYYNYKILSEWLSYSWPKGTFLTSFNNLKNHLIK